MKNTLKLTTQGQLGLVTFFLLFVNDAISQDRYICLFQSVEFVDTQNTSELGNMSVEEILKSDPKELLGIHHKEVLAPSSVLTKTDPLVLSCFDPFVDSKS